MPEETPHEAWTVRLLTKAKDLFLDHLVTWICGLFLATATTLYAWLAPAETFQHVKETMLASAEISCCYLVLLVLIALLLGLAFRPITRLRTRKPKEPRFFRACGWEWLVQEDHDGSLYLNDMPCCPDDKTEMVEVGLTLECPDCGKQREFDDTDIKRVLRTLNERATKLFEADLRRKWKKR